jgi:hypothetical protein
MKIKDMRMSYSIGFCAINFWVRDYSESPGNRTQWWLTEIVWGKDRAFTRKRQAIAYAEWQCKAFNDSQKGK